MTIDRRILSILYYNNINDVNKVEKFVGENNNFYEVIVDGEVKKLKIPGKKYENDVDVFSTYELEEERKEAEEKKKEEEKKKADKKKKKEEEKKKKEEKKEEIISFEEEIQKTDIENEKFLEKNKKKPTRKTTKKTTKKEIEDLDDDISDFIDIP